VTGTYKVRFVIVFICILLSSIASISVSLSLKFLIDDFISPLIGQKDPKELRSFIQDVKSAAYSIGKQVDRNLGKSEQEFMTDEFAIPEEKTEKPAKSKKSPER